MSALWAEEAGSAGDPLIVVIHGSMDRSTGMLKLSRRLDADFRVLRYDRRGYGRSFPHDGPFTMDVQVGDLVRLLAGRRAVLVGHSYGGDVALAAAEQHPELIAGVAVYETPLSWEPWWPGTTAGAIAVAAAGKPQEAAERFMRRMLGDERWEELPERTRETRLAEGVAMVEELADLRSHRPWIAENIAVPVVTAYGGRGRAASSRGHAIRRVSARLSCCGARGLSPRRAAQSPGPVEIGCHRPIAEDCGRAVVGVRFCSHGAGGTSMSDPRNVHVTSVVSPSTPRALTLSAHSCNDDRCVHTPKASPPISTMQMIFAVTFLMTSAEITISAPRPTATAMPMFLADSSVIAVMVEP